MKLQKCFVKKETVNMCVSRKNELFYDTHNHIIITIPLYPHIIASFTKMLTCLHTQ